MILRMLLICLVASQPPGPPNLPALSIKVAPGATYSPKHAEFKASLGNPMVKRNVPAPARLSFAPPSGFTITNITVQAGQTTIGWQQGTGPFQLEGTHDIGAAWSPVVGVGPTMLQNKNFPAGQNRFWRIRSQVDLLQISTNQPRLQWQVPEIQMADSLGQFTIQRRNNEPPAGQLIGDNTGWNQPGYEDIVLPSTARSYTDNTPVGTGLWFRNKQITANGVVVPYPIKQLNPSTQPPGSIAWLNTWASGSVATIVATVVLANGDIVFTGFFKGTLNFGGSDLVATGGGKNLFIVRLTSSRGHVWSYRFGGTGDCAQEAIAVDASENIYLAGHLDGGNFNFGGATLSTPFIGAFLVKYNSSGAHQWSQMFNATTSDKQALFKGVAIDSAGSVIVTGYFQGTVNFGGSNLSTIGALVQQTVLCKYNSSGGHIFSKTFVGDSGGSNLAGHVTTDSGNNIYFIGEFSNLLNLGGSDETFTTAVHTGTAGQQVTVAVQDSSPFSPGDTVVEVQSVSPFNVHGRYTVVSAPDATHLILQVIFFNESFIGDRIYRDKTIYTVQSTHQETYLAKFSSGGRYLWSHRIAGRNNSSDTTPGTFYTPETYSKGRSIAIDPTGAYIAVTGEWGKYCQFGNTLYTGTAGAANAYVARYTTGGVLDWSVAFIQTTEYTFPNSVRFDGAGNVIAGGGFNWGCYFGPIFKQNPGNGGFCGYIVKINSAGVVQWVYDHTSTSSGSPGLVIATNPDLSIVVGGGFAGPTTFDASHVLTAVGLKDVYLLRLNP